MLSGSQWLVEPDPSSVVLWLLYASASAEVLSETCSTRLPERSWVPELEPRSQVEAVLKHMQRHDIGGHLPLPGCAALAVGRASTDNLIGILQAHQPTAAHLCKFVEGGGHSILLGVHWKFALLVVQAALSLTCAVTGLWPERRGLAPYHAMAINTMQQKQCMLCLRRAAYSRVWLPGSYCEEGFGRVGSRDGSVSARIAGSCSRMEARVLAWESGSENATCHIVTFFLKDAMCVLILDVCLPGRELCERARR